MEESAKLIWDFRGPQAKQTAEHHLVHLKEYFELEGIQVSATGVDSINEFQQSAYCIVPMALVGTLRTTLKPHRGQRYTNHK